jgi:hypothetical protein
LKRETAEKWDLSDPSTLKYYPKPSYYRSEYLFPFIKNEYVSQVDHRISFIKIMAETRKKCSDPMSVERVLRRVGKLAGATDSLHYGYASYINHHFDIKARTALFNLLRDIEEAKEVFKFQVWRALVACEKNAKK